MLNLERSDGFYKGMDFGPDGLLYAVFDLSQGGNELHVIDLGKQQLVDELPIVGWEAVDDIDFAPDGWIYHTNYSWALFRIDPSTAVQTLVGFGDVAGMRGLASASTSDVLGVTVDIQPDSESNLIRAAGRLDVALLSGGQFDATTVSHDTVTIGPAQASPTKIRVQDIDHDGALDVVYGFRTHDTGLPLGVSLACLSGSTIDDLPFVGCDTVDVR